MILRHVSEGSLEGGPPICRTPNSIPSTSLLHRYLYSSHLNCKSNSYPTPDPTFTPSLNRSTYVSATAICHRHLRFFPTRTLRHQEKMIEVKDTFRANSGSAVVFSEGTIIFSHLIQLSSQLPTLQSTHKKLKLALLFCPLDTVRINWLLSCNCNY